MVEAVLQTPSDRGNPSTMGTSRNAQKKRKSGGESSVCSRTTFNNEALLAAALERAKELQASLSPEFPSIVKHMLPSHVTGGFWLGFPKKFCDLYLPKVDTLIALEDESREIYQTKYLAEKMGLSGGWRGFSIAHNLLELDVLVFHLIQPHKFKVYIVRSQKPDEVDGALGLLKLDKCKKPKNELDMESIAGAIQGSDPENRRVMLVSNSTQTELLEQKSEEISLEEATNGIRLAEFDLRFEEVTGIENFNIMINRWVLDSMFTEHRRAKYYELCRSQRCFLHKNLLPGLNFDMVAGMIKKTIDIAEAIEVSKITIPVDHLVTWNKILKGLEFLGMNVRFLRTRLDKLMKLALKLKRYKDARLERLQAKEELEAIEEIASEVKKTIKKLDEEIAMQESPEKVEAMFEELANAPW
ncbi:B3 domain-containing protein Os01g0234100-like isoform X2 [Lotus japonicus]|uniref:B3 domain-containing protein Os01g0234100-like isoform X2 n=1 Tax=Lotus japonicus TaxID=34305 RepID=UPI0025856C03|nr:B3 domain-containing protein Os01g0234100-like isoform X2 [Lotus japonicus]